MQPKLGYAYASFVGIVGGQEIAIWAIASRFHAERPVSERRSKMIAGSERHSCEIVGVQHLRGFAAIGVVLSHADAMLSFEKYFGKHVVLGGMLKYGALGVDLFFLISGFIMAVIALRSDLSPKLSVGEFAQKRFTRIIPFMWLAIISYAALRFGGRGEFDLDPYVRAIFLFPAGHVTPNLIWTLRHEAIFYCFFAASFLMARRHSWLLAIWAISPILYAALDLPAAPETVVGQILQRLAYPVNVEFAAGLLVGIFWLKKTRDKHFDFPAPAPLFLLGLAFIFLLVGFRLGLGTEAVSKTLISSALCAPILFAAVHVKCANDRINAACKFLGDASYSIYLFHSHIVSAVLGVWAHLALNTPPGLVIAGTSLLAVAGGAVIHVWVERPLVKVTRRAMEWMSGGNPTLVQSDLTVGDPL